MVEKFNIGRDATLQIVLGNGRLLKPALLTNFTYKQETIQLKSRPINGRVIHRVIPDGWSGTFEFDRAGPEIDDYFAQAEADYYNGLEDPTLYVTQTIREVNRQITQFRFMELAISLEDGGSWKQDDKVSQRISWMAAERRKVL